MGNVVSLGCINCFVVWGRCIVISLLCVRRRWLLGWEGCFIVDFWGVCFVILLFWVLGIVVGEVFHGVNSSNVCSS